MGDKIEVATKTCAIDEALHDKMYKTLLDYRTKWRGLPAGLLLGPNEWMQFKHLAAQPEFFMYSAEFRSPPEFHGVPLYPMQRRGIEAMPSEFVVPYLALETVELSTTAQDDA